MICYLYKSSILLIVVSIPYFTIFSMEQQIVPQKNNDKTIGLQLFDNKIPYEIALWKVTQESNTLCENYYTQKQKNPIIIENISTQEIKLFDKALDTLIDNTQKENTFKQYYNKLSEDNRLIFIIAVGQQGVDGKKKLHAQRLTGQLADIIFDSAVIRNKIFGPACEDFKRLILTLKYSIISDNIQNNNVIQEDFFSYGSDLQNKPHLKTFLGGRFKIIPMKFTPNGVANLSFSSFNGDYNLTTVEYEGSIYMKQAVFKEYVITSSKIKNGRYFLPEINVWNTKSNMLIKSIQHVNNIECAIFSPYGKWIVSYSAGSGEHPAGKLMLTSLDNSDSSCDSYLSDIVLVEHANFTSSICFNNSSKILVNGRLGYIEFFDLVKKQCIKRLPISFVEQKGKQQVSFPSVWPLTMRFNHDDSRLIALISPGLNCNKYIVMVWDTSDLKNIKQLSNKTVSTKTSSVGNMFFNPLFPNIVAISTPYATMFFDVFTGAFLSKTLESLNDTERNIPSVYAGTTFMPFSSIALVGMNKSNKTSCVVAHDYMSGDCVGIISYKNPCMNGIGFLNSDNYLFNTFDGYSAIKTHLITDNQIEAISKNVRMMNLVDFYALFQLHRAKQKGVSANLSQPLVEYIKKRFFDDAKNKEQELIKKYFFS